MGSQYDYIWFREISMVEFPICVYSYQKSVSQNQDIRSARCAKNVREKRKC